MNLDQILGVDTMRQWLAIANRLGVRQHSCHKNFATASSMINHGFYYRSLIEMRNFVAV